MDKLQSPPLTDSQLTHATTQSGSLYVTPPFTNARSRIRPRLDHKVLDNVSSLRLLHFFTFHSQILPSLALDIFLQHTPIYLTPH